jgi:hypothetical protein
VAQSSAGVVLEMNPVKATEEACVNVNIDCPKKLSDHPKTDKHKNKKHRKYA